MARQTFISYKYSEARELRDLILKKLGDDVQYYRGEDGFSDDLSTEKATKIKRYLADMIHGTSVTIVILSPSMSMSRWIPWEIEYSLTEYTRNDRTSHTNGVVCVVQNEPKPSPYSVYQAKGTPDWLKTHFYSGMSLQWRWDDSKLFSIIKENRNNKKTWQQSPIPVSNQELYNSLSSNYIEIVTEDVFLRDPSKYIEGAYMKSQNIGTYNITKRVGGQNFGGYYYL
jgi:hypothetical protein